MNRPIDDVKTYLHDLRTEIDDRVKHGDTIGRPDTDNARIGRECDIADLVQCDRLRTTLDKFDE